MGRRRTPEPDDEAAVLPGCWAVTLVGLAGCIAAASIVGSFWPLALAVPPALMLSYLLYGKLLLLRAWATLAGRGVLGVLVYSDSPNWRDHVRDVWLPRLGDRVMVLNWSERGRWERGLSVRLFDYFLGRHQNFNPSVLLFRGLREPLRFRFFYAFRDAKHGNTRALERLEARLWAEIDSGRE